MVRESIRIWLAGVCLLLGLCSAPAAAAARKSQSRPLVIRLAFTRVVGASPGLLPSTDGRHVAFQEPGGVLVIDQQTGQSTVETLAGQGGSCHTYATAFAGPWLAGGCITTSESYVEQLYSLATGTWRTIDLPPGCVWQGGSGYSGASECDVGPAGADWLGWEETCWNCGSYGGVIPLSPTDAPLSQVPPTTATGVIDFNSPTLSARVCRPLRDTPANHLVVDPWGRFVADQAPLGRFALAYGPHNSVFLERCGARVRRRLAGYPITGNASELLFDQNHGATMTGLFLPSLRKFVIHVPHAPLSPNGPPGVITPEIVEAVKLSSRTLYIVGRGGELWQAPAPHRPTANRKHAHSRRTEHRHG